MIRLANMWVHDQDEALAFYSDVFTEEPEERPYGIDAAFRDPSGNSFRLTQVKEMAAL